MRTFTALETKIEKDLAQVYIDANILTWWKIPSSAVMLDKQSIITKYVSLDSKLTVDLTLFSISWGFSEIFS